MNSGMSIFFLLLSGNVTLLGRDGPSATVIWACLVHHCKDLAELQMTSHCGLSRLKVSSCADDM